MAREYRWSGNPYDRNRGGNKLFGGIILLLIGVMLLLKKLPLFPYFDWHTIWPFIVIMIGLFIGIQKRFRNHIWWILILVGVTHLIPEFMIMGTRSSSLMVPLGFIIGGLVVL